jgi:FtsZ-interacting cell division protein YlmF
VLTDEQQRKKSSNLKFVYDLPTSKEDVHDIINELETPENVLIALQRIKDLHNPAVGSTDADQRQLA